MLLQAFGQLLGDGLAGAKLLLDVREFMARFLEQELADAEVKRGINIDKENSGNSRIRAPYFSMSNDRWRPDSDLSQSFP